VLLAVAVFTRYTHTYFFYDEWSMIDRVTFHSSNVDAAFESFNGHLWVLNYLTYFVQVRWLGIADHLFVYIVFCSSLLFLHLSLAGVLRELGLPAVVAVLAAAVVVYFGPGAQNMVFEVQLGPNLALAFSFVAALVVLRWSPSPLSATGVSAVLLLAFVSDSSIAAIGLVFVAVLVGCRWRERLGLAALLLPVLASIAWLVRTGGDFGPDVPVGLRQQWEFAVRLALRAVGGLAGNGELVGGVVVGAAAVLLLDALRRRVVSGRPLFGLAAGGIAAAVATATVAHSRAGIVGNDFVDYNRYIQLVAIFALVALLPPLYQALRPAHPRGRSAAMAVTSIVIVAVFLSNWSSLRDYRQTFEGWNVRTKMLVAQSIAVLDRGCPPGLAPDPEARPLGALDPTLRVALLDVLRRRHDADLPPPRRVDPLIRDTICSKPAGAASARPGS
jgi:hypothetical protein